MWRHKPGAGPTPKTSATGVSAYLVAWWKCDEGSGTTLADSSGSGNNATDTNTSWQAATGRGTKPSFNGNNSLFTVTASSELQQYGKTSMTVMAWCYAKSDGGENYGRIMDNEPADGICEGPGWSFFVMQENAEGVRFAVAFTGDATDLGYSDLAWGRSDDRVSIDAWHHVAGTFNEDSDKRLKLYVDGAQVDLTEELQMQGNPMDDSGQDLGIGAFPGDGDEGFDGYLDDIRIYSRALTAAEILTIKEATD